jgi:hypothetical protein
MKARMMFPMLAISAAVLSACGGGSGGGGDVASGGIGGTSTGTVTGFGGPVAARAAGVTSIEINDARSYTVKSSTAFTLDDDSASVDDLQEGMVVEVELDDDADDSLTQGSLERVHLSSAVKGPVTGLNPLRVLDQEIVTDGGTVFPQSFDPASLQVGDIVEVHGQRETDATSGDSIIRASFLHLKSTNTPKWVLTGTVSNLVANTSFTIGGQTVQINGVDIDDCRDGLDDGDRVKVRANADASFVAGETLDTVTEVKCKRGAYVPDDFSGNSLRTSYEGIIDSVASATQFTVGGQTVLITANTEFERGTLVDIVVGARVEVEGLLNVDTDQLQATEIKLRESRFRVEGPVGAGDVTSDTITVFGIDIQKFARTRDEDNVFGGASGAQQVRIEGFVDGSGVPYARRVELEDVDAGDYELRGPVANLSSVNQTFTILGVIVDVTSATFEDDADFRSAAINSRRSDDDTVGGDDDSTDDDSADDDIQVTTSQDFFSVATAGQQVKVEGGTYNAGTNTISNAVIELED